MIFADKNDPKKLVSRTCGVWLPQWWGQTSQDGVVYGDFFFKSIDGGSTWINITPGQQGKTNDGKDYFLSNPLSNNGYGWITNKAIHGMKKKYNFILIQRVKKKLSLSI